MIHVEVDFKSEKAHVEVNGQLSTLIADICTVLREICEKCDDLDPELLIDVLKTSFLYGMKREKEREAGEEHGVEFEAEADGDMIKEFLKKLIEGYGEGAENEVKDERSKEALQGANRRYRRVRPH